LIQSSPTCPKLQQQFVRARGVFCTRMFQPSLILMHCSAIPLPLNLPPQLDAQHLMACIAASDHSPETSDVQQRGVPLRLAMMLLPAEAKRARWNFAVDLSWPLHLTTACVRRIR
jgi:hypothetical protein